MCTETPVTKGRNGKETNRIRLRINIVMTHKIRKKKYKQNIETIKEFNKFQIRIEEK